MTFFFLSFMVPTKGKERSRHSEFRSMSDRMKESASVRGGENKINPPTVLILKKGSHSVAWKCFNFREGDKNQKNVMVQRAATNTRNHLKRHHGGHFDEAVKTKGGKYFVLEKK